ncbi:DUF4012 domain-containing protein [Jatrophihabitans telluris]|uniref:DUF4012 domain-containing protein n=1 Tax=Jatrophihabitans telluris TaxID=2038343 RepID=A0ABY4R2H7_9ACTN|nr:DUF4012 domain-containing protein [Jatrophihabitans telluris]UQX89371.1 DUF4012 domain-containing protein [Jatrophihabitans telluris]
MVTGIMAKHQLDDAQRVATKTRSQVAQGDVAGATASARIVAQRAHRAHQLSTGPAWWVAAHIPWLGRPIASVRGCTASADTVGRDVLAPLSSSANGLVLNNLINRGQIDLKPIIGVAPVLNRADEAMTSTTRQVNALPHHTWLAAVDRARNHYGDSLAALGAQVAGLNRAASILPDMLGSEGRKRYFVGLENEAESRGLGGIPGAFAIATAENGKLSFTRFESDTVLYNVKTGLDLGPEYTARYSGSAPWDTYPNSTISPDFRDAAQIWAAMWRKYSGQEIDGAVAIDPTAISYLLKVTGPATLPDKSDVSADNVVALTQQQLYTRYPKTTARKNYLLDISSAISDRLLGAPGSAALVHAAGRASGEGRLLVWAKDSRDENILRQTSLSGTLEPGSRPFSGFTTVNAAGGKLDYYLRRAMRYQRSSCASNGTSTATLTLTNDAPASGLPAYVTVRADKPPYPTKPGDNKLLVNYYYTNGSRIVSVVVNGQQLQVIPQREHGLSVFTVTVELRRATTTTVTVVTSGDPGRGPVQILRQPGVLSLPVAVQSPVC